MSFMKLSKTKSHLKNKCTVIKINDNGYPKELNIEKLFSKSCNNKSSKFILEKSVIYHTYKILNKKKFLDNIEKVKIQIENFNESLQKERFKQSMRFENLKKSTFDNYNFDYLLSNLNVKKINNSLNENLKKEISDKNKKVKKKVRSFYDKELEEIINSKNKNNEVIENEKNKSKLNINKNQNNLNSSNNSTNKLFNSSISSYKNNSLNLSLHSISSKKSNNNILKNFYFIVPEEKIEEGRKEYFFHKNNEKKQFNNEYIKSFKNWKISNEDKLLPDDVLKHFEKMEIYEKNKNIENEILNLINNENSQNEKLENNFDQGKLTLDDLIDNKSLDNFNNEKNENEEKIIIENYDNLNININDDFSEEKEKINSFKNNNISLLKLQKKLKEKDKKYNSNELLNEKEIKDNEINYLNYNKTEIEKKIKKKEEKNTKKNLRYSEEEENENWAEVSLDNIEEEISLPNFINEINKDIIKGNLRELLNMICIDNYEEIKNKIKNIIKDNNNNQEKFIDLLFLKAIYEPFFQPLYSKLCFELDKFLINKKEKIKSALKLKIIDNCKKNFASLKKINDKKYFLGNIHFICELINNQLISKKGGTQCITNLLEKFFELSKENNVNDSYIKYLYLESIIIFIEKFGTQLINNYKDNFKVYKDEIDKDMNKLKEIYQDTKYKDMPSYIKYKLINLIEKEKNNWKPYFYESLTQIPIENIQKAYKKEEKEDIKIDQSSNHNLINSNSNNNSSKNFNKIKNQKMRNRNKSRDFYFNNKQNENNDYYYENNDYYYENNNNNYKNIYKRENNNNFYPYKNYNNQNYYIHHQNYSNLNISSSKKHLNP